MSKTKIAKKHGYTFAGEAFALAVALMKENKEDKAMMAVRAALQAADSEDFADEISNRNQLALVKAGAIKDEDEDENIEDNEDDDDDSVLASLKEISDFIELSSEDEDFEEDEDDDDEDEDNEEDDDDDDDDIEALFDDEDEDEDDEEDEGEEVPDRDEFAAAEVDDEDIDDDEIENPLEQFENRAREFNNRKRTLARALTNKASLGTRRN